MNSLSRKQFLMLVGASIGSAVLGGCGGGVVATSPPNPRHFRAAQNGSVLENTTALFDCTTHFDASINDYKVVGISYNNQPLLSGEYLVFEINNGGQLVGGGVSAAHTQVTAGDIISWKSVG